MIWFISALLIVSIGLNVGLVLMLRNAINEIGSKEDNFGNLFAKLNSFYQMCSIVLNDHRFVDDPTIRRFVAELKEIELFLKEEQEDLRFEFDIPDMPVPFQGYHKTLAETNK